MATAKELLSVSVRQLNVREDPPGSNNVRYNTWYYGREVSGKAYPWCMAFVQWVFAQAGVKLPARTASCGTLMNAAKSFGIWVTEDFQPGDVAIYDFSGKQKTTEHCGIVEQVTASGIVAIEGNTSEAGSQSNGGMVCRKKRPWKYIVGAVRPVFEEEAMDVKQFTELWREMRKNLQDNDSGKYSQEARAWAVGSGLICGSGTLPDGTPNYMWEDVLTREQLATVLFRFAQKAGLL